MKHLHKSSLGQNASAFHKSLLVLLVFGWGAYLSAANIRVTDYQGPHQDGAYNWYGDFVRYYAGSFKADGFTYKNCLAAAKSVYSKMKEHNKTVKYNRSKQGVRLDSGRRFLVFGFRNETDPGGAWACVNVTSNAIATNYYFSNNQAMKSSRSWVKKSYNVNGKRVGMGFADQDSGGNIHYYFNAN